MAFSSCFCHSSFSFQATSCLDSEKIRVLYCPLRQYVLTSYNMHPDLKHSLLTDHLRKSIKPLHIDGMAQRIPVSVRNISSELYGLTIDADDWSFIGGSKANSRLKFEKFVAYRKCSAVHASWLPNSQLSSSVFSLGTVAVLPYYTLMVLAPKAELTKKSMESSIPYVVLGLLYAYLLYLSWTPETVQLIFASKYLLPELPGIVKMFSSEMTLASAWIHLLVVDLFAARQVFLDGQQNEIETRHSVSLCLLFCPVGIISHVITKELTKKSGNSRRRMH